MAPELVQLDRKPTRRHPRWLKIQLPTSKEYFDVRDIVEKHQLHTVCKEAHCPNMSECWSRGTATFMILGDTCTRSCGFCAVKTGRPIGIDLDEPRRVADAAEKMGLRHAVVTSVNRDELADGGASIFAATIREIKYRISGCTVEVLIPDFQGNTAALKVVTDAGPEILNHNVETIPRLYRRVRPQADFQQSLDVLLNAKRAGMTTKSGFMLGLGEERDEVLQLLQDLRKHEVDIITIGQYLQPTVDHLPVDRYVKPEEFDEYKVYGLGLGFSHVESGPLVRSSYHAEEQVPNRKS